ncbi:MAG: hypothetical protein NT166_28275 [Candidatus Aminicenantes bacterium]|nr:hypothetical protein [Candidatus Aminicenantes bacterium]
MEANFYRVLSEMAQEAIQELERYEASGDDKKVFDKIRAVAAPCLDGQKINQSIKDDLQIRDHYDFQKIILSISRLNSLSRSRGNNKGIKSCLEYVRSKANQLFSEKIKSNQLTVFYSWQASLPSKTNRGLIRECLEKAIKDINKDISIESRVSLDSDTSNTPGSPDIIHTILKKIDSSSVFVADVSLINKLQPNSNVMFELGYATKALGDKNIVMVFNENFGEAKDLPFDLGLKRQTMYRCTESEEDMPLVRKKLTGILKSAISLILQNSD